MRKKFDTLWRNRSDKGGQFSVGWYLVMLKFFIIFKVGPDLPAAIRAELDAQEERINKM